MTDVDADILVRRYASGELTAIDVRRHLEITYGQLFERLATLGLGLPRLQRPSRASDVEKARRWMFPPHDD